MADDNTVQSTTPVAAPQATALSGAPDTSASPIGSTMAATSHTPVASAEPVLQRATPSGQQPLTGSNTVTETNLPTTTPTPPPAAGQQSVWKNLVMGAIYGLAGSAGAKHFGGGLAMGAAGELENKQRELENVNVQKQLQFESVKAADAHVNALDEHRRADQLNDESKLDYKQKSAEYQAFLQDNFGIEPDLSFNDSHNEAVAALRNAAESNRGEIPPVTTVQHPAPDGQHGTISAFSPTQEKFNQNVNGYRDLINTQRAIQGMPDIDDATWNSMGFKGQRNAALDALNFLKPTPMFSLDKTKPDYLPVVLAQKQQQLQQYQNHKDINGKADADPAVVKQLQNGIDYLNNAWDTTNKKENEAAVANIQATAPAKAAAAAQEETARKAADLNTPQGRAELAKTYQETINAKYANAENHQKALFDQGVDPLTGERLNLSNAPDEALVDQKTGQPIPTKMLSVLKPTQQESNRADFAQSTLHILDTLDQLKAQGKLPNGPITGLTKQFLAKHGFGDKEAQDAINNIALAQSAATGAHVGGRFNQEIMKKMAGLINLNMNDSQFQGAEDSIRNVMTPYAQQGGRETVVQYKANLMGQTKVINGKQMQVTGFDRNGQVILTPTGK